MSVVESHPFTDRAGAIAHYAAVRRRMYARAWKPVHAPIAPVAVPVVQPIPVAAFRSLKSSILTCRDGAHHTDRREMASIFGAVSEVTGVDENMMKSPRRYKKIVLARQIFFYVAKHHTGKSMPAIGRFCGRKDHATVLHGVRRISRQAGEHMIVLKAVLTKLAIPHDALKDWGRG